MRQNPCRYCKLSFEWKGKHMKSYRGECQNCENFELHQKYLESKRMFKVGEPITELNELLSQTWVMLHGRTKHIEVIKNFQFGTVEKLLNGGSLRKAIKKPCEKENKA